MKKKTIILFFIPQLVGGGAEKVTMNIMKILDKNIFDVHLVVTTIEGSRYNIPNDITVHDLKISKTIFSLFQLRKVISRIKPDLLFSSLIRGHIAIYLALFVIRIKPYIILRSPNSPKLLIKYKQINFIQKILLERSYKYADMIMAQTPEMKDEIEKYYFIDRKKINVFLNPIDAEIIENNIINITNPFDEKYINIVAAGRITYQKGFDILIKSFAKVLKKNNLFRLFIIGEDIIGNDGVGEIEKLQKMINKYNLEKYIVFLGYQDNPYKYFYFSDLYVLSSRWEGLPNTVLENLYLHKPVISTRCIPFMDTLIDVGKNGYLVDVEDIDGLSKAILEYKKITLEFTNVKNIKENVNNFFKGIK